MAKVTLSETRAPRGAPPAKGSVLPAATAEPPPAKPPPDTYAESRMAEGVAPIPPMTPAEANAFVDGVIDRERPFYQPGAGYDAATGVTFDGETIDFATGAVTGHHRFSAASKESLSVGLWVKALEGDAAAQRLLTPDPAHPEAAVGRAIEVLRAKISTYERFNRDYPGFGGFLPWYEVKAGRIEPERGWGERVPSLDNGELAWALYAAAKVLRRTGHPELADHYDAQLALMKKNAVRIFFDPEARQLRAEARLGNGAGVPPGQNSYFNNVPGYFLDDACEGLMMCHFADLFGDWSGQEAGKDALWAEPRSLPARYVTAGGRALTAVQGNWFSSHEQWGFAFLPFRDLPVADALFKNAQKVRTWHSADRRIPGLFASTTKPVRSRDEPGSYLSALGVRAEGKGGVRGVAKVPVESERVAAPYAAFPLALVDKPMFATWLRTMLEAPRMWGPSGIGESFDVAGDAMAPVLTWDGKALEMLAWMGGLGDETRAFLKEDGLYEPFMRRVQDDYRAFADQPIEGEDLPLAEPTARVPQAMPDFRSSQIPKSPLVR
jgi:hypothetical protein